MKIRFKTFAGAVMLMLAATVPVLASPTVDIDKNYSSGEIRINVNEEVSGRYTVMVIKDSIKTEELFDNIPGEDISSEGEITRYNPMSVLGYSNEFYSDNELIIEMKVSGSYTIYIASKRTGEKLSYPVTITSKDDYFAAIGEINGQIANNDKDEFYNKVLENKDKLGFDLPLAENQKLRDISDLMFNEKNGTEFDASDYKQNIILYKSCIALDALNKGTLSAEAAAIIEELIQNDNLLKSYYNKHVTNDERKAYLNERLKNKGIVSTKDLKNKIRDALILTVVRYPDGYMNIKEIFGSFKTELGIASVTADVNVYSNLVGNYENIEKLTEKYNSLSNQNPGGTSGGTGGGKGTSGGKSISGGTVPSNGVIDITPVKTGTVRMPFDDLDTVSWAYEAISALADAKIISGKSETKFAPRDNVKREEFVKMIVGAMGEGQSPYSNIFNDVEEGAWYSGYVLKAYQMNIVGGIGDDLFGTGRNITRQDMAVMIYKALIAKGTALENTDLTFADSDDFSDYAREPVAALANVKIINGQGDNTFNPKGEATRAEAASMIYGMYKLIR